MSQELSDFAIEQHRVYAVQSFALDGDQVLLSGFAFAHPDKLIRACFPNAKILDSWQEHHDPTKLHWPLELIGFHIQRMSAKRFRFRLNCLDFQREWESDWPKLL